MDGIFQSCERNLSQRHATNSAPCANDVVRRSAKTLETEKILVFLGREVKVVWWNSSGVGNDLE